MMKRAKQNRALTTVDIFAGSKDDMPAVAMVLPHTDYFMPSIEEAQALTGLEDMGEIARHFIGLGVKCCVFTLGGDGAYYHHADGTVFKIPAFHYRGSNAPAAAEMPSTQASPSDSIRALTRRQPCALPRQHPPSMQRASVHRPASNPSSTR
jgi:hypothetical protein